MTAWSSPSTSMTTWSGRMVNPSLPKMCYSVWSAWWNLSKPRPRAGLIRQYYESSKVVDDHTIEVTLAFPAAASLNVLGMEYVKILPRHVVEAGVDINLGENMVGTGPYKFVKYVKGNRLEFEKNQDYWREELPYLDGINKIIINDIGRIIAAFKAGQVMTSTLGWTNLTVRDYLKLAEDAEDVLSVHRLCCDQAGFGLMMNVNKSPTDDARVRRAIFVAVDREAINQANIAGAGTVGSPCPDLGWAWYEPGRASCSNLGFPYGRRRLKTSR